MRGPEFDFVRAEDKDAGSPSQDQAAGRGLPGQGPQEQGAARRRSQAIDDHFAIISASIRRVEAGPAGGRAEPRRGLAGVRRAGLPPSAVDGRARRRRRVLSLAARARRAQPRRRRARHDRQHAHVAPLLLPRRPAAARSRHPAPVGLRPGQPPELLPLVEHARRGAAGPRRRGRPAPARGARRRGPADAARRPRPRPGHRVRRQLARLPPVRGAQQRRPRAVPDVQRRAAAVDVRGADPLLHRPGPATIARSTSCSTANTRSSTRSSPGTTACPSRAVGPDGWVRVDDARQLRARRAAADGGLPDQELAGPANQPGQARLLGRPPAARREHPRAAGQRPRPARATRPSSAS